MQQLGYRMEEMIFTLADQNFFFNEIEVSCNLMINNILIKITTNYIVEVDKITEFSNQVIGLCLQSFH